MKSLMQIAIECGLTYNYVYNIMYKEQIIPAKKEKLRLKGKQRIYFDQYQEDYLHHILYFSGMITEITLESKMNIPEPEEQKETFKEFKLRIYGKAS